MGGVSSGHSGNLSDVLNLCNRFKIPMQLNAEYSHFIVCQSGVNHNKMLLIFSLIYIDIFVHANPGNMPQTLIQEIPY
jgi:hypothetical protein